MGPPARATRKSFDSYLLQDQAGSFERIIPVAWHHLCYSYNITGYSQMVMVSFFMYETWSTLGVVERIICCRMVNQ